MFIIFILLSLLFLIWGYFLATTNHLLPRLREAQIEEYLEKNNGRFFYLTLQQKFLKSRAFDLLIMASSLGANFARIAFALFGFAAVLMIIPLFWPWQILLMAILLLVASLVTDLAARISALNTNNRFFDFFMVPISLFLTASLPINLFVLKTVQRKKILLESQENDESRVDKIRETILEILQSTDLTGPLTSGDKKLIEAVLKFKERIARQVMVPRTDLFTLSSTTTIKEAAKLLLQEGYSRTPVYRENIDNIIGVLMYKDLFEIYSDCIEGKKEIASLNHPIGSMIKGVIYAPETKKVSFLLQEFRAKQMHMAIVIDEYGGTEGVITIEDILEEIVGDISDEYDMDHESFYTPLPGGNAWIVDARMTIFDAESIFNIHIPKEGDYDTIGGYIFHKVGTLPAPQALIVCQSFDMEILSVTERNVEKIRLTLRNNS